jgi:hypothetical protein
LDGHFQIPCFFFQNLHMTCACLLGGQKSVCPSIVHNNESAGSKFV